MSLFVLAFMLMGSVSAADQTITEDNWGGLKEAIEKVGNGQTVYMENGQYGGENNRNIFIDKNVTISGKGNKVSIYGKGFTIFHINPSATVTLKNIKISNDQISGGRAIANEGTLYLSGCTFTANAYSLGGAIYNKGYLSVSACTFEDNLANYGGAIYNDGNLLISGSTFTNNKAIVYWDKPTQAGYGGAIYNNGTLSLNTVTFKNNIARDVYNAIDGSGTITYKNKVTITPVDGTKVKSVGSGSDIEPNTSPNTGNNNDNYKTIPVKSGMKETGTPLMIILVLLSALGLLTCRKQS